MSKPLAGLLAIVALLVALLAIYYLGRKTKTDDLTWRKAFNLFKKAETPSEKWFVVFLCSPMFLRKVGYMSLLATIATAGFGCIGVVFGDPHAAEGWLGLAKKLITRTYPYIERTLHGAPSASPSPIPSPTR
jgi:hypothetical protein